MKSAQAYLKELLGDPDKAALYLRELATECHSAKEVGHLMLRLAAVERVDERRLKHKDVYQAFTDAAKLATEGGTTGRAFRDALNSWKAEEEKKAAKKAAAEAEEAAKKAAAEAGRGKGNPQHISIRMSFGDKEKITIEADTTRQQFWKIVDSINEIMRRDSIYITDKTHDLCDPLLAISPSQRRFLPRRRAWAAAA